MKVSIIGTGYVGLVTGACFADMGNDVLCLDIDQDKVSLLNDGKVSIYEPLLSEIVNKNLNERLRFSSSYEEAILFGDIIFIAVGTPSLPEGGADLKQVISACEEIGIHLKDYKVIVNKSTVPVGTFSLVRETITKILREKKNAGSFDVVSNPEFLKEGDAVNDFRKPDRIIIGSDSERAIQIMRQLYLPFNRQKDKFIVMDNASAELTKYAANAMLATKISFMNEISQIAERLGADVEDIRKGIGSDTRIGNAFIYAGAGYGGSCFPKDVKALTDTAIKNDYYPELLHAVEKVNQTQKESLYKKINFHFDGKLESKKIALWGLSFKPGTDDVREAPSITLINQLLNHDLKIKVYDPEAMENFKNVYVNADRLEFSSSPYETISEADALVVLTEWKEFRTINLEVIKESMVNPVIFDGRNIYDPYEMKKNDIFYYGIGRGRSTFAKN